MNEQTDDEAAKRWEMKRTAGLQMLERAERAKQAGEIRSYIAYSLESDPGIVDHIVFQR